MVYEGVWVEGNSEDLDANMNKATKSGFSGNWKSVTKVAKKEREERKERDMDDLRSFISQSVRSGMSNASGSLRGDASGGGGSQLNGSNNSSRKPSPYQSDRGRQQGKEKVNKMPWSDVNGFSGHYSGDVNSDHVPDGRGFMQYSNGVVEEGMFCNGVYQPPSGNDRGGYNDDGAGNQGVPSSSMSVWSLKSSPTMAFAQGGHNVFTGRPLGENGGNGSVMGAPTSVHLGGPSNNLYGNADRRY
mmetsp:Transcript_37881/g.79846  ORF Transcript_37881/g.79846 Transcript_37881/m.79846 type:complete len:244 (+) Transcript_37881:2-733(+)